VDDKTWNELEQMQTKHWRQRHLDETISAQTFTRITPKVSPVPVAAVAATVRFSDVTSTPESDSSDSSGFCQSKGMAPSVDHKV